MSSSQITQALKQVPHFPSIFPIKDTGDAHTPATPSSHAGKYARRAGARRQPASLAADERRPPRAVWGRCGLSSICRCRREAGQGGSLPVRPNRGPESHPWADTPHAPAMPMPPRRGGMTIRHPGDPLALAPANPAGRGRSGLWSTRPSGVLIRWTDGRTTASVGRGQDSVLDGPAL